MYLPREFLLEQFGDVWPEHLRAFSNLLVECRRYFGGDLDKLLIVSIIGERQLTKKKGSGIGYNAFLQGRRVVGVPRFINTQSIADSTGIPRETVRRKVGELMRCGLVRRRDDRMLEMTENAAAEIGPLAEATLEYLLAMAAVLIEPPQRGRARAGGRISENNSENNQGRRSAAELPSSRQSSAYARRSGYTIADNARRLGGSR